MTLLSEKRNPFTAPDSLALSDIIDRVRSATDLSATTKSNWVWALGTIVRAIGKSADMIPAHPAYLRKAMEKAAPKSLGITTGAWNNGRSLAGKALEWAGLVNMPARHHLAPLTPAFQTLQDKLGKSTALHNQTSRLFHYCSAQGIKPDGVTDDVMTAFHLAMVEESIVKDPYEVFRSACRSWNNAAATIPGWPQVVLTVPSKAVRVSYDWDKFPPSLRESVDHYLRRAAGLDLLDDHFNKVQSPNTITTRAKQLRHLASAIVDAGVDPATLTDLQSLLIPEIAARGIQVLLDRHGGKTSVQISNIATFLPTLARRLDMDLAVIDRLKKVAAKVRVEQSGMTDKNREVLRAFDDPAAVSALLNFPTMIRDLVRRSGKRGYTQAKLMQTAVAVALLIDAPVRRENLASIEVGRHLIEVREKDGSPSRIATPMIIV